MAALSPRAPSVDAIYALGASSPDESSPEMDGKQSPSPTRAFFRKLASTTRSKLRRPRSSSSLSASAAVRAQILPPALVPRSTMATAATAASTPINLRPPQPRRPKVAVDIAAGVVLDRIASAHPHPHPDTTFTLSAGPTPVLVRPPQRNSSLLVSPPSALSAPNSGVAVAARGRVPSLYRPPDWRPPPSPSSALPPPPPPPPPSLPAHLPLPVQDLKVDTADPAAPNPEVEAVPVPHPANPERASASASSTTASTTATPSGPLSGTYSLPPPPPPPPAMPLDVVTARLRQTWTPASTPASPLVSTAQAYNTLSSGPRSAASTPRPPHLSPFPPPPSSPSVATLPSSPSLATLTSSPSFATLPSSPSLTLSPGPRFTLASGSARLSPALITRHPPAHALFPLPSITTTTSNTTGSGNGAGAGQTSPVTDRRRRLSLKSMPSLLREGSEPVHRAHAHDDDDESSSGEGAMHDVEEEEDDDDGMSSHEGGSIDTEMETDDEDSPASATGASTSMGGGDYFGQRPLSHVSDRDTTGALTPRAHSTAWPPAPSSPSAIPLAWTPRAPRTPTTPVARVPPAAGRLSASSSVVRLSASSSVVRLSASASVVRLPASPSVVRLPASPSATRLPVSPISRLPATRESVVLAPRSRPQSTVTPATPLTHWARNAPISIDTPKTSADDDADVPTSPTISRQPSSPALVGSPSSRPSFYHQPSRSMIDMTQTALAREQLAQGLATPPPVASPRDATQAQNGGPPLGTLDEDLLGPSPSLVRRRSLPLYTQRTASPPPYPSFFLTPQPREDEGRERLPAYTNDIFLCALMPRKMEFAAPGVQARDRKWRRALCVLEGTAFRVYTVRGGGLGGLWEKAVGAGDIAEGSAGAATAAAAAASRRIELARAREEERVRPPGAKSEPVSPAQAHTHTADGGAGSSSSTPSTPGSGKQRRLGSNFLRRRGSQTLNSHPSANTSPSMSDVTSSPRPSFSSSARPSMSSATSASTPPSPPAATPMLSSAPEPASADRPLFHAPGPDAPAFAARDLQRQYTLQQAESGLASDYHKRRNVIRCRMEGEQFLLQAPDIQGVVDWIEGFQAAANIAQDLDERPMPRGPLFPRRRRRRPRPDGEQQAVVVVVPGSDAS